MKEGYEKYCRNGLCEGESRPKKYNLDEHCHEDLKDKCWYSGCQCPGERLIIPEEQPKYPIGGYAPGNYMCNCSTCKTQFQGDKRAVQCEPCAIKMVQKQNIIDMMKGDEELGLYDEIQPEQIWNEEKKKGIKQLIQDHKKETLEEAGVAYAKTVDQNHTSHMLGFLNGAKWQQDKICNSEVLQRIRASKSDAEARRIIRTL